jgi:hypothetical protein
VGCEKEAGIAIWKVSGVLVGGRKASTYKATFTGGAAKKACEF